jgi:hypothetical protein
MVLKRLALEYGVFSVHLYSQRTNRRSKNGHATRKSHGHTVWAMALVLILYKEDPPKLYKNESATKSNKWC